jgi:hypothetical protein
MKKRVRIVSVNVVLSVSVIITLFIKANHTVTENLVGDAPETQSVEQQTKVFAASVKAKKYTTIPSEPSNELPNFFERDVEISVNGNAFRVDKVDPDGVVRESEMYDGEVLCTKVIENNKKVETTSRKGASPYDPVEFNILNLGLVAIISYLSDPATEIKLLKRTVRKQDKFEVKVGTSSFIVYLDAARIVRKVEIGKYTIGYGDYRLVDNRQIPFLQMVFIKGDLRYELAFKEIDFQPEFPEGFFSRFAL